MRHQPIARKADIAAPSPLCTYTAQTEQRDSLAALELALLAVPDAGLRCQRATLLDRMGRTEEARAAFLAILAEHPDHLATLNAFGALLHRTGFRSAARTVFTRAVTLHPRDAVARVNLGNLLRQAGETEAARMHFAAALQAAPDLPQAHQGFGDLLAELGDQKAADHHWRLGYHGHALRGWVFRGSGPPVRVLMPISAANGNIAARQILDDRVFAVTAITMEFFDPTQDLPPHDIVLNAIGDADLCRPALRAARVLAARSLAPVLNTPERVLTTGRANIARSLGKAGNVIVPRIKIFTRAELTALSGPETLLHAGFEFPLLLRAPGFHTGRHFARVASAAELGECVDAMPERKILAIDYFNPPWSDGKSRKGRVLFIDGVLYPMHWAVSADWKVHYFTADMAKSASYRAEEASFLADPRGFLGDKALAGLQTVAARLGLDYGGIDFGLSRDGSIVLFEANATMAIVPPGKDSMWDYRRPASDLALLAAQNMLIARSCGKHREAAA
jgi:hypothetical protein